MTAIIVFFVAFLLLAFLRIPVGFAIIGGGIIGYVAGGISMNSIPSALFAGLDSFPLLAIPAFILSGDLMAQGGISSAIMDFLGAVFKRIRGSMGAVLVCTSMIFGAICGSSVATVSAVGGIMLPEMHKAGYDKSYTTALISAAGFLGILIPPSVPGIIYALSAGQKVTQVWMSTLVPGLVLGLSYIIVNYFVVGRKLPKAEGTFKVGPYISEIGRNTPKALVAFIMPLIIFGGVYGGIFTATEAGVVAVVYGLIAGWIIYPVFFKQKPENSLAKTTKMSAVTAVTIALLISSASIIGRMVAMGGITAKVQDFLMGVTDSKYVFLLIVNLILILVGMFLETNCGILLFAPIFVPIAQAYGIDPVHFGAIMLLNLEIGLITPPFAANLFVGCKLSGVRIDQVMKPLLPFYGCCLPVLLITTYVPAFSLWLPGITG
ncbi:MAG: TRAP transporter large permease [Anaerovoracaceae bacterium]